MSPLFTFPSWGRGTASAVDEVSLQSNYITYTVKKKGKTMENTKLVSPPEAHYTVYKLTDRQGKVYIGCTGQTVKKRWRGGRGYQVNSQIGRAIRAYGWDSFSKEILCKKLTKEGGEKLEKWFVEYYDSLNPEKGYNGFTGGNRSGATASGCTRGNMRVAKAATFDGNRAISRQFRDTSNTYYREHPELRRQIASVMSSYLLSPAGRKFPLSSKKAKPVMCVETGEVYRSAHAAEKATGLCSIHKVCQGRRKVSGGYHWEYVNE